MNQNGIQIFARAYNAASTAGNPAAFAIQIGKGLKGKSLNLYKSAGKVIAGSTDLVIANDTSQRGLVWKDYNENTGVLVIDAAFTQLTSNTANVFQFSDITSQNNGYLVVNASKNPALTGLNVPTATAARFETRAGQVISTSSAIILYELKKFDTDNAYNSATGEYTVLRNGKYLVTAYGATAAANWFAGQQFSTFLHKNGAQESTISQIRVQTTLTSFILESTGSALVDLKKGDILTIRITSSVSTTLRTADGTNWFSIVRTNEF
jgi:hypothetical protein